jgi:hypothetical protein
MLGERVAGQSAALETGQLQQRGEILDEAAPQVQGSDLWARLDAAKVTELAVPDLEVREVRQKAQETQVLNDAGLKPELEDMATMLEDFEVTMFGEEHTPRFG